MAESAAVEQGRIGHLRVAVATGRGGRENNEDTVGVAGWVLFGHNQPSAWPPRPMELLLPVLPNVPALIALADGMGGEAAGDLAARTAAEALTSAGPAIVDAAAAGRAFRNAHERVIELADERTRGMGCTAALLALHDDGRAIVANTGDVRAYRVADGYAGLLSEDHRAQRNVVTRSIGGSTFTAAPYVHPFGARPGDRVVLCSDGVHDLVDPVEIGLVHGQPASVAVGLVNAAMAAGNHRGDNATVVVIDIRSPANRS